MKKSEILIGFFYLFLSFLLILLIYNNIKSNYYICILLYPAFVYISISISYLFDMYIILYILVQLHYYLLKKIVKQDKYQLFPK